MIKAIETEYNGFLFRSRLEARWAIFFDEIGRQYSYESEGYEVATGVWYLPDFKLEDCYVELKHRDDADEGALEKMGGLVAGLGIPGVIVYGDPYDHEAILFEPTDMLPCGFKRSLANFTNIENSLSAALKARQARFQKRTS